MINKGKPLEEIQEYTGLSLAQINKLREEMNS